MKMNPLFLSGILDAVSEPVMLETLQDKIMYGLQTTLLGMGVVFAALIILWAVLAVFKLVFYKPVDNKSADAADKAAETAPVVTVTPAPAPADDAELVAAITAAIAMAMDAPATSFRVVSFRRTAKK